MLCVGKGNVRAIEFYKKNGFKVIFKSFLVLYLWGLITALVIVKKVVTFLKLLDTKGNLCYNIHRRKKSDNIVCERGGIADAHV